MSKLTDFRIIDADHVRLDRLEDIATAQAQRIEQLEEEMHDLRLTIEEMQKPEVKVDRQEAEIKSLREKMDELLGYSAQQSSMPMSPPNPVPIKSGVTVSSLNPFMQRHRKIKAMKRLK